MHSELRVLLLSSLSRGAPEWGQITIGKVACKSYLWHFAWDRKYKCTIYSLLNHWRLHPHHPMMCHISHQTSGACSPFWTTHPPVFQGLLFSAMVYQNISQMLWSKIELWRLILLQTRLSTSSWWRWTTIQLQLCLLDWRLQLFPHTNSFILIYACCLYFPKRIFPKYISHWLCASKCNRDF